MSTKNKVSKVVTNGSIHAGGNNTKLLAVAAVGAAVAVSLSGSLSVRLFGSSVEQDHTNINQLSKDRNQECVGCNEDVIDEPTTIYGQPSASVTAVHDAGSSDLFMSAPSPFEHYHQQEETEMIEKEAPEIARVNNAANPTVGTNIISTGTGMISISEEQAAEYEQMKHEIVLAKIREANLHARNAELENIIAAKSLLNDRLIETLEEKGRSLHNVQSGLDMKINDNQRLCMATLKKMSTSLETSHEHIVSLEKLVLVKQQARRAEELEAIVAETRNANRSFSPPAVRNERNAWRSMFEWGAGSSDSSSNTPHSIGNHVVVRVVSSPAGVSSSGIANLRAARVAYVHEYYDPNEQRTYYEYNVVQLGTLTELRNVQANDITSALAHNEGDNVRCRRGGKKRVWNCEVIHYFKPNASDGFSFNGSYVVKDTTSNKVVQLSATLVDDTYEMKL